MAAWAAGLRSVLCLRTFRRAISMPWLFWWTGPLSEMYPHKPCPSSLPPHWNLEGRLLSPHLTQAAWTGASSRAPWPTLSFQLCPPWLCYLHCGYPGHFPPQNSSMWMSKCTSLACAAVQNAALPIIHPPTTNCLHFPIVGTFPDRFPGMQDLCQQFLH